LDRRHCNLTRIPEEVWRNEQYLEELLLDMNGLQDLPPKFFRISNLRILTVSENELLRLSPMISNLTRLTQLDVSKNALEEIPDNIRQCRCLSLLDISSNPLLKVPECLTMIKSLTILAMNDCSLPRLPTEIGNLENLQVLEARENLLKSIPRSIQHLKNLVRLDLGNNEIEELPPEIGCLVLLEELWLDSNQLRELPEEIGNLGNLVSADITKNKLEFLPASIRSLVILKDLHVSENYLTTVPETIGEMKGLLSLKLDMNRLLDLPESLGSLRSLTELALFENMIDAIPPTLFNIPCLDMLDLGRNHIVELPAAVGRCKKLHVLSLYDNMLTSLPDELGELSELKVLNLAGNRLTNLPISFKKLHLDALWLDGNQLQPLIPLHPEPDPDDPSRQVLICSALPQKSSEENSLVSDIEERRTGSGDLDRKMVAFDPNIVGKNESFRYTKLVRFPTPRRPAKGDKKKKRYKPNLSLPAGAPIIKKHKEDEMVDDDGDLDSITEAKLTANGDVEEESMPRSDWKRQPIRKRSDGITSPPVDGAVQRTAAVDLTESAKGKGQLADATPDLLQSAGGRIISGTPSLGPSTLQTVEVAVELHKQADKGLGFSIAGGKGSTPAYEDVDESIFITKIAPGGIAESDGRLRLGDKLLSVNGQSMLGCTHQEAVAALKRTLRSCLLVVSREVLVVMPSSAATPSPGPLETAKEPSPKRTVKQESSSLQDVREFGVKISAISQERPVVCEIQDSPLLSQHERKTSDSTGEKKQISSSSLRQDGPVLSDEEAEGKLLGMKMEMIEREEEGFVVLEPDSEGVPIVATKETSSPKKSGDYANLEISGLIEANKDEEEGDSESDEDRVEKVGGVALDKLVDSSDSTSSSNSDSDSDSDVVVLGPKGEKYQQYPEEDVILNRGNGLLGLKIVGGADHTCKPFGNGQPGIFVSKVTPGGAAAASGKLRVGDRILEVNGSDVRMATHDKAVSLLIERRERIALVVQHEPPPPGLQEITLTKGLNDKLGLSIRGGVKRGELDEDDTGIYISKVISGGAAAKDGRLSVGQRILEVNNQSLLGAAHMDAVRALKNVQEKLTILVCDGLEPEELEKSMPVTKKNSSGLGASQEELLAIEQSEKEINSMLTELGTMEDENKQIEAENIAHKGRVLRSPSGTFELPPEASHHLATVQEKMERMKESVEKEAQAHLEMREQLKREQSEKDLTKLKEIEELEKQAQEAEEKSMALKEQVRRKSELAEKKIFEDASRLEELRKKAHEERLDRAARSASVEQKPESVEEKEERSDTLTEPVQEEVFVAPEGSLETTPLPTWESGEEGKPGIQPEEKVTEQAVDSEQSSSVNISSSGGTINVALRPTVHKEKEKETRVRKGVDNRPMGSLKDRMAAFQNNKGEEEAVSVRKGASQEVSHSKFGMERSGSGDKIRKISPTEPAVAPSPSTTTTTTVNKEEGIVEEPSMEGKERLSFGADSKLQKEMERIERSIKMAAKRMNGQEKAKDAGKSNPYVDRVLSSMPAGIKLEDVNLEDKQSEERTKWRESRQKALNNSVKKVEDIIGDS
jgi:protein scribble